MTQNTDDTNNLSSLLEVIDAAADAAALATLVRPLPQEVMPSPQFLVELRAQLLRLDGADGAEREAA